MEENNYIIKAEGNYYQLYDKNTNKVINFDFGTKFYCFIEYDNYLDILINKKDNFRQLYNRKTLELIKFDFGTKFYCFIEYDNYFDILINKNDKFKKYDKKTLKKIK